MGAAGQRRKHIEAQKAKELKAQQDAQEAELKAQQAQCAPTQDEMPKCGTKVAIVDRRLADQDEVPCTESNLPLLMLFALFLLCAAILLRLVYKKPASAFCVGAKRRSSRTVTGQVRV